MAVDPVKVKSYAECICKPYIKQVRQLQKEVERLQGSLGVRCSECRFQGIEKPDERIETWQAYCKFHGTIIGSVRDAGRAHCSWGVANGR